MNINDAPWRSITDLLTAALECKRWSDGLAHEYKLGKQ